MTKTRGRTSFTLRFENEDTHATLRLVAQELGLSMNHLAEQLIGQSLRAVALTVEDQLSDTLEALRSYRGEGIQEDWAAFARAEVEEEDPIQTRPVLSIAADRYGVAELFAQAVD